MDIITPSVNKAKWLYAIFFLKAFLFPHDCNAQSTPIYATSILNESNVDNSSASIDGNLTTRARIRASSGVAIGIGAYSGNLEIQFPTTIPANTTTYVKIQTEDNILPSLLGGSLGTLLSNALGTALIGNQQFTVEAKNGATVVLQGRSEFANEFATSRLSIVANANNEYFISLTPSQAYRSIKLTNRLGALVGLGNTKRLDVYEAFYIETPDICGGASYTSFDGNGLNLDLLSTGGAGVTNPNYVLDSDPDNFSRLSMGVLGVAASIEQTVYFDGTSQLTDQFFVKLKIDPSLLAVGVANNINIIASNGPTIIQSVNLNTLLNQQILTLLQGGEAVSVPFSPNATVNRITVRYNSLLNVQLTQRLDFYGVTRTPAQPIITDLFTLDPTICSGSAATLIAESNLGTELVWYSQAQGGAPLAIINSGQPFVTPVLTQNTSYYVAAKKTGCQEESLRVKVDITVINVPTDADISVPTNLNACNGSIVISPISSIGGATFRYYKDQLKNQEIVSGYSGDAGVTYVINPGTGELTITGLTAINSPYHYFISLTADGLCENAANTLKEVVVNYSSALALNVASTIQGCESVNLRDAILNFDSSSDITYTFSDSGHTPMTSEAATNIQSNGIYYVQSSSLSGSCSSLEQQVAVTINQYPTLNVANTHLAVNLGTSVTLEATSNATITWYGPDGNELSSNIYGPFTSAGLYTFTVIADNGSCSRSQNVSVIVIDSTNCPSLTERVYANNQSWSSIVTGSVSNAAAAVDGNPQTHSTITTGIGLLGIGTTWQTLQWNQNVAAGTTVKIKLGSEYSALTVAGAYSVVGTKRNGSGVPVDIGSAIQISGTQVGLLAGENVFEFSFIPSDNTGPKDYDGIRIIVNSVVSLAQNIKIYEAYYERQVQQIACSPDDAEDVFYGAVDLGVGVTTATVGVDNPYQAIDSNETTYATMYSGLGVLASADLTIAFRTPSMPGDSLKIILSRPSTILSLGLMDGFSIQMFMGDTPMGGPLDNSSTSIQFALLNGGTEAQLTVFPQTQQYDRIQLRLGGVAGVLDLLRVHEIQRLANTTVAGADITNTIDACPNNTLNLSITPEDCATFIWYDAAVGGNVVSTGTSFTVPDNLAAGTYTYYIQPVRYGCEVYQRGTVTVNVGQTAPPNAITEVQINGGSNATVCSTTSNVSLTAVLNSTMTITNPVFYWYSFDGTSQQLIAGQTTSNLVLNGLAPGTYTYYVGISSDEYCQTAESDRTTVTFTVLPFTLATEITADDNLFCLGIDAVITPMTTLQNPQFSWYFSNDNSQPIINGSTVGGVTFTIETNGTLTVSGLTSASSPYTYYVGATSDTSCLNQNGDFKPVVITVSSGTTPTTTNASQSFCLVDNPTIADIQVNETGVTWYDTPTNGNVLASSTTLTNGGVYYASIIDGTGCPSSVRLAITTTLNSGTTPTTTNASQNFCLVDNPTIADIQVNETGVTWYDAPTNGNVLASSTILINGGVYYASMIDGTGCESSARLAVTTTLNSGTTPTTTNASQSFCLVNNPTIADIQVNETGVTWYDAPTNGNVLASSTILINGGVYYASIIDGTGCPSSVRLAITTTLNSGTTPTTTNASQSFCLVDNPTIADIQVNETGVTWYDAPTNGNVLASSTILTNGGVYYASIIDGAGCESSARLAVTATIGTGTTPTSANTIQSFCQSENATLVNIQVNETGITWYDAATGGNLLPSTTLLTDGGIYYASIVDASGCASSIRLMITVNFQGNAPALINGGNNPACAFDVITYTTNPGMSNYLWNVTNGTVITGGQSTDDYITISWSSIGPATVTVDFINGCSGHSVRELALNVVSCSDLTITKTVDNLTPTIDSNVVFTISVTNVGSNQITDVVVNELLPSGYSFVSVTAGVGTYNSGVWEIPVINANETVTMQLTARVLSTGNYTNTVSIISSNPTDTDPSNNDAEVTTVPLCLIVYNEFSPNQDGSNEYFIIDCIENYPNNKLHVYNRYGTLVYERSHYSNDWNGTANVSGVINVDDKLPTGTYYYVLDVGIDNIVKSGWLSIAR